MKISTLSILAGSTACNARCPFCVSKMTPKQGLSEEEPELNWRNLKKAAIFAKSCNVSTAIITGKGEPTLFPNQITKYLRGLQEFNFPFIELQTNGITISEQKELFSKYLKQWYWMGLTTIIISIVHYDPEENRKIYTPHKQQYQDIPELVEYLHKNKFSVRLNCTLYDGGISSSLELEKLISFSKNNSVDQLSIRPVNKPSFIMNSSSANVEYWICNHSLKKNQEEELTKYLETNGKQLLKLSFGATVYDVDGQNVCFTNCLTNDEKIDEIRHLIFFPDGHLRYDWQYPGAILL
jgi:molybdenum cofactor biosynthesis enzyme MoaA